MERTGTDGASLHHELRDTGESQTEDRATIIPIVRDARPPAPRWFGFPGDGVGINRSRATTELDARRTASLIGHITALVPELSLSPAEPRYENPIRQLISNSADSTKRHLRIAVEVANRKPVILDVPSVRDLSPHRLAEVATAVTVILERFPKIPLDEVRFDHAFPFNSNFVGTPLTKETNGRTVRLNGFLVRAGIGSETLHEKDVFASPEVGALSRTDAEPIAALTARAVGFLVDTWLRDVLPGQRTDLLAGIVESLTPETAFRRVFPDATKEVAPVGIGQDVRRANSLIGRNISSEATRSEAHLFSELFCETTTAEFPRQPASWFGNGLERLIASAPH